MPEQTAQVFDLVVVGGGPGGYPAAIRAAQLGLKTLTDGVAVGEAPAPPSCAGRALATPLARAVANDLGVDLAAVSGSGRGNRIRRPDAQALQDLRAELKRQLADRGDVKVSVDDLSVMACARLLRTNPDLYVSFGGDRLLGHRRVHVGIAVALDGGLIVPVVRDADTKTLTQVTRETEDLTGGTFMVSNLGMYGTDRFTAPSRRRQRQWNSTGTSPAVHHHEHLHVRSAPPVRQTGPPSLYYPPAYARPCRQGHRRLRPDGGT
jgi:pyruvate/2-oxoglutarate dehydrogenase complex dihydrolipoamide acyltransferase (E2) component